MPNWKRVVVREWRPVIQMLLGGKADQGKVSVAQFFEETLLIVFGPKKMPFDTEEITHRQLLEAAVALSEEYITDDYRRNNWDGGAFFGIGSDGSPQLEGKSESLGPIREVAIPVVLEELKKLINTHRKG